MSQVSSNEDLSSISLIERRKRLHELASEINQWEDESNKKNCISSNNSTPVAPPLPQDFLLNNSNKNMNSPNQKLNNSNIFLNKTANKNNSSHLNDSGIASKVQKMNNNESNTINVNTTITIKHHSSSDISNKENALASVELNNILSKKTSLNSGLKNKNETNTNNKNTEIDQMEMINVAKKILAKREIAQQHQEQENNHNVKAMKEKYENMISKPTEQSTIEEVHLTPRLLIKKFEAMSKENNLQPSAGSAPKLCEVKTTARITSFLSNVDSAIQSSPISNSTKIIDVTKSSERVGKLQIPAKFTNIEYIDSNDTTDLTNSMNSDFNDDSNDNIDDTDSDISDDEETEIVSCDKDADRTLTPKAIVEKFELMKNNNSASANNVLRKSININSLIEKKDSEDFGKCSLTYVSSLAGTEPSKETDIYENINQNHKSDDEPLYEELNSTNQTSVDEIYMRKQEIIKNFKIDMDEDDDEDLEEEDDELDCNENETDEITDTNTYSDNSNDQNSLPSQNTSKFTLPSDISERTTEATVTSTTVSRAESFDTISQYDQNSDAYSISSFGSESNQEQIQEQRESEQKDLGIYSIKDYRRQKKTGVRPRRSVLQGNNMNSQDASDNNKRKLNLIEEKTKHSSNNNNSIKDRIKELEELIKHEENIINQTGSALEQCFHDSQFTGSIEHVECNRLLLIACQKRQSYLTEISRLKQKLASNANKDDEIPEDLSGTLVFSDIQLPIKESYMNKLRNGDEKRIFNFICLLRYGIQVLQTQVISVQELVASKDTIITFPNRMAINNVDVNFKVKIDVYAMETNPKEKQKRSPNKLNPTKFFSPFKSTVFTSHHESNYGPFGGSSSAKTSNFIHIDTIEITHKDIARENFKLNISSSSIPLIGVLHIEVRCMPSKSIELRGFLTMFEDVSGYGAWDRRWFMLSNNSLSFWKYPEDEFRKSPLGSINLIECTTDKAQILSRDICARKYTIELICVKPKEKSEESDDSLISKSYDKYKFTKYWLSADTRENANDWINHINWALTNLRLWNPNAVKPIKKTT